MVSSDFESPCGGTSGYICEEFSISAIEVDRPTPIMVGILGCKTGDRKLRSRNDLEQSLPPVALPDFTAVIDVPLNSEPKQIFCFSFLCNVFVTTTRKVKNARICTLPRKIYVEINISYCTSHTRE